MSNRARADIGLDSRLTGHETVEHGDEVNFVLFPALAKGLEIGSGLEDKGYITIVQEAGMSFFKLAWSISDDMDHFPCIREFTSL